MKTGLEIKSPLKEAEMIHLTFEQLKQDHSSGLIPVNTISYDFTPPSLPMINALLINAISPLPVPP